MDSCGQRQCRRFVLSATYCRFPCALDEGGRPSSGQIIFWELLHYVWLAELFAKRNNAAPQSIAAAGIELQMQERHAVECTLRYVAALPDDDAEKQIWNSIAVGELRLKKMKKSRKKGSSGGQPGFTVSCAQRRTIATSLSMFKSYFELVEWWIYDVFIHADDFRLIVPAVCRRWRLAEFLYALIKWHKKDTAHSLIFVEQKEKWLVARAYSGRHCWYEYEKKTWPRCFAPTRLFENLELFKRCPCRFWVRLTQRA